MRAALTNAFGFGGQNCVVVFTETRREESPDDRAVPVGPHRPPDPADRAEILADPGFGRYFTDQWRPSPGRRTRGWHDAAGRRRRRSPCNPARRGPALRAGDLRGAQGVPARRRQRSGCSGRSKNAAGSPRSARRLALPELRRETSSRASAQLVRADKDWVPPTAASAASTCGRSCSPPRRSSGCGRPREVTYCVIASPGRVVLHRRRQAGRRSGSARTYTRAAPGGTGAAKCGGNYAASLAAAARGAGARLRPGALPRRGERALHRGVGDDERLLRHPRRRAAHPRAGHHPGRGDPGQRADPGRRARADAGGAHDRPGRAAGRVRRRVDHRGVRRRHRRGDHPDRRLQGRRLRADGRRRRAGQAHPAFREQLLDIQSGRAADTHGWMRRVL